MEEKKPVSHFIGGLVIALILIAISVSTSLIANGNSNDPKGGWTSYVIIISGLILLINLYGKAKGYRESFGNLFTYGFKTTTMLTLVFVIFLVIVSFVSPEQKQKALEAARTELVKNKSLSDKDIEQSINLVTKYFWVFAVAATVFGFIVVGVIGSLIGAAITKKIPNDPSQKNFLQSQ